ncbi:sigma factor [Saccharomonospora marina]|uniref:sigma factor n=1 Tax=Saccharomonospora marina TaxID=632569 RepID=UPI001E4B8CCA|nr:sigma factor [Saccharomonospora marina]
MKPSAYRTACQVLEQADETSIAYRLLGSVSEAEDAVQEAWRRFRSYPIEPTSTKAFLSVAVSRIAIDILRSVRVRREQ